MNKLKQRRKANKRIRETTKKLELYYGESKFRLN
jgi:hypothetical protein